MAWLSLLIFLQYVSNLLSNAPLIPIPFKKVLVWFQNSQQRKKDQAPRKKNKPVLDGRSALAWTVRKVVREKMSDEVDAVVLAKDPGAKRGTTDYLILVQDCLTSVIEGLSKEKLKEFADLADLRNAEGVDVDLKAKWVQLNTVCHIHMLKSDIATRQANKHLVKVAKQFMDLAYKQMGVHVFMLVGYKDSEGNAVKAKCVDCLSMLPFRHLTHF
jgi:hypothetical protein